MLHYCGAFLYAGYLKAVPLAHWLGYLVATVVLFLSAHVLARLPTPISSRIYQIRSVLEAIMLTAAIVHLGLDATPVWLLFIFPMIVLTRGTRLDELVAVAFGLTVITIVLLLLGAREVSVADWFLRFGFLGTIAAMIRLLPSTPLNTSVALDPYLPYGRDEDERWHSLARKLLAEKGADALVIYDFRAIGGHCERVGMATTSHKSLALQMLPRSFCPTPDVFMRLRQHLDTELPFPVLASLAELPQEMNKIFAKNYFSFSVIERPQDPHVLGFLCAEYSREALARKHLWGIESRVSLSHEETLLAEVLNEKRVARNSSRLALLSQRLVGQPNFSSTISALTEGLGQMFALTAAVWEHWETEFGSYYQLLYATGPQPRRPEGLLSTASLYDDDEVSSPRLEYSTVDETTLSAGGSLTGGYHRTVEGPLARFGEQHYLIPAASEDSERARALLITLHCDTPYSAEVDLENIASAIRESAIMPALLLSVEISAFRERARSLSNLGRVARKIAPRLEAGPLAVAKKIARFLDRLTADSASFWVSQGKGKLRTLYSEPETRARRVRKYQNLLRHRAVSKAVEQAASNNEPQRKIIEDSGLFTFVVVLSQGSQFYPRHCIVVMSDDYSLFQWLDETVCQALAGYLTLILDASASAFSADQERGLLAGLNSLGSSLIVREDQDIFLRSATEVARRFTKASYCTLHLLAEEGGAILRLAACNDETRLLGNRSLSRMITFGQGIIGEVAQTSKPTVVPNTGEYPNYRELFSETRSEAAVPIIGDAPRECLGVLNVESDRTAFFDSKDLETLERVATVIGIGLQLHRQLEELEEMQQQLQQAESLAVIGLFYGEDIHRSGNQFGAAKTLAGNIERHIPRSGEKMPEHLRQKLLRWSRRIRKTMGSSIELVRLMRSTLSPPKPRTFSLHKLLRSTVNSLQRSRLIEVRFVFDCGEPDLLGLQRLVGQVFRVVLHNAIKVLEGSGLIIVETSDVGDDSQSVLVSISDDGPGMDEYTRKELFTFKRGKKHGRGMGIGLPWSKLFLTRYGGQIEVESELGAGTRVLITLPRRMDMGSIEKMMRFQT